MVNVPGLSQYDIVKVTGVVKFGEDDYRSITETFPKQGGVDLRQRGIFHGNDFVKLIANSIPIGIADKDYAVHDDSYGFCG